MIISVSKHFCDSIYFSLVIVKNNLKYKSILIFIQIIYSIDGFLLSISLRIFIFVDKFAFREWFSIGSLIVELIRRELTVLPI
jgi:hypothetical protein